MFANTQQIRYDPLLTLRRASVSVLIDRKEGISACEKKDVHEDNQYAV